ncbi:hypothetical protein [Corticicoccus populi]|uniref:Uncharacterized protein n=1 Tax=Corticicoccus populi TaxID=1812821 RepID=A0ABW5WY44_9STAP
MIAEIVERAKERQKESIEIANMKNPKHKRNNVLGSAGPNPLKPTNTNQEIGKLAGVCTLA